MNKTSYLILLCFLFSCYNYAQEADFTHYETDFNVEEEKTEVSLNNQIKVNLATLLWGTGSINYERRLSKQWTIGLTANYRPKSSPPFKSTIQDVFGDKTKSYEDYAFDVDQLEYGNWSISPELKVYLGKAGAFKGFYIAAFAKYENIDMDYDLPLSFDINERNIETTLPLTGSIKPWSGGIYIGYQWQLGNSWFLDLQLIGGNFGAGTLEVASNQSLTQDEQDRILSFADQVQDELSDVNYEVDSNGARIWGDIPWFGLRTGISIGFVF
ncbi:MAG TPA: DUF3575 domain-containing protein [Flavobacteriaceae bacterium]|nr:DUF3575 domain-containing protein [Flavobacteriaceae bacterium]